MLKHGMPTYLQLYLRTVFLPFLVHPPPGGGPGGDPDCRFRFGIGGSRADSGTDPGENMLLTLIWALSAAG